MKRQAETRTNHLVEKMLSEKQRKAEEEERLQQRYSELLSARERN